SDRNLVHRREPRDFRLARASSPPVPRGNPELADRERQAREHHEFHEIPALHVMILGPVDREIRPPGRLYLHRPPVGRNRHLLGIVERPIEVRRRRAGQPLSPRRIDANVEPFASLRCHRAYTSTPAKGSPPPTAASGMTRSRGCSTIAA